MQALRLRDAADAETGEAAMNSFCTESEERLSDSEIYQSTLEMFRTRFIREREEWFSSEIRAELARNRFTFEGDDRQLAETIKALGWRLLEVFRPDGHREDVISTAEEVFARREQPSFWRFGR